jgi:hypothetical protein
MQVNTRIFQLPASNKSQIRLSKNPLMNIHNYRSLDDMEFNYVCSG